MFILAPRMLLAALSLGLAIGPAVAAEIACEGAFAADSSEARLIEIYGRDNVVTGEIDGPEGTTIIATSVFPNDPAKRFDVIWWDETELSGLSYVALPAADTLAGVKAGMSVAEVEALNGEPFMLLGFYWDYGGSAGFESGKLANLPGGCNLGLEFHPSATLPEGTDTTSIEGDVELRSDLPLLREVDARVEKLSLGYPHPEIAED